MPFLAVRDMQAINPPFTSMLRLPADSRLPGELRRCRAFTLIELLTVIGIILILAGLVLGLAGNAQTKGAISRATTEIQAFSTAANNYQIDNGSYPRPTLASDNTSKPTDALDPRASYDPAATAYIETSLSLYQILSGTYYLDSTGKLNYYDPTNPPAGINKPTIYFPFKDSQLRNSGGVTSGYLDPRTVTAINDPFGFSYGYSTAYQADIDAGTNPPTHGYNPTFDLWSSAGYSASGGKTYPSPVPTGLTTAAFYSSLWVKNW